MARHMSPGQHRLHPLHQPAAPNARLCVRLARADPKKAQGKEIVMSLKCRIGVAALCTFGAGATPGLADAQTFGYFGETGPAFWSEHRVAGRGYDMELHLVHTAGDGTNAVVGVFLKRGKSSGALAPIFENLPAVGSINVKEELPQAFNPAAFLPKDQDHFRYLGSLTTPPCTEGVPWFVLTEPVTVSDEDIAQFAERIHFNARLVQRKLGH
jgi:carbonic anhydrase